MPRTTRPASEPPENLRRFGGGLVSLFGEMLVVGLTVTALSLTIVLAVPAMAAGVDHLRRSMTAHNDSLAELFRGIRASLRNGWLLTVVYVAAVLLLCVNAMLSAQGYVPGGMAFTALSCALALVIAIVACRAAGLWRPGSSWPTVLRQARTVAISDPIGSSFVVLALAVGATLVWMLPPLIVIVPGMLAFAVMAADTRQHHVSGSDRPGPSTPNQKES